MIVVDHIRLSREEFQPAVDFMSAYHNKIRNSEALRDFNNKSLVRSAGDSCADVLMGKLAELMFQKFVKARHDIEILLDFEIHEHTDGGQDIPGHFLTIDIKATRTYSQYLLVERQRLTSDVYVLVRVDMPRDLESWSVEALLQHCGDPMREIYGEVCGYAYRQDFWDGNEGRPYLPFARGQQLIRADFFRRLSDAEWTPEGIQKRLEVDRQDVVRVGPTLKAAMNYGLPVERLRTDWLNVLLPSVWVPDLTLEEEIRAWSLASGIDSSPY